MKLKSFFVLWGPVFLWLGLIFSLSSIPTLPAPEILWWDFILKKSAHVIEYAILYFLVYRAVSGKKMRGVNFVYPFVFCFLYSLSDEYHQSFVPGRHCKLMDVGFDSLGILLSIKYIKKRY